MKRPIVMGIDPSLTGTGVVVIDGEGSIITRKVIGTPASTPTLQRIRRITHDVLQIYLGVVPGPSVVVIEQLVQGQTGKANDRAGLHWLIRSFLSTRRMQEGYLEQSSDAIEVAPGTLKKWVTGTGSAEKNLMLLKTFKRWGVEFSDDNECDAYCLARWGLAYLKGEVKLPVPKPKKRKSTEAKNVEK